MTLEILVARGTDYRNIEILVSKHIDYRNIEILVSRGTDYRDIEILVPRGTDIRARDSRLYSSFTCKSVQVHIQLSSQMQPAVLVLYVKQCRGTAL